MSRAPVIPIERGRRSGAPVEPASGMFTTPDGAEVYFEDTGGDGTPLFFVYGLACSIRHFKYPRAFFGEELAERQAFGRLDDAPREGTVRRQIHLDFRGHGASAPLGSGERLSLPLLVDDIKALCDFRGVASATFVGQSMGGSIVLSLASRYPALVKALVLLASPARDPSHTLPMQSLAKPLWDGMIALNRAVPLIVDGLDRALRPLKRRSGFQFAVRELVRTYGFNPALSQTQDIDQYLEKVYEVPLPLFYDMAGALKGFDAEKLSPPVEQPTLIVAGAKDLVVPATEARRLAKSLPRGELFMVPHGSHCPHFDDPRMVCNKIAAFLKAHGA